MKDDNFYDNFFMFCLYSNKNINLTTDIMLDVKGRPTKSFEKKRDRNNQWIKLPNGKGQGFPLTLLLSYGLFKKKTTVHNRCLIDSDKTIIKHMNVIRYDCY